MATRPKPASTQHLSYRERIELLASEKGIKPVQDLEELALPDFWESEEELESFIQDVYASREADLKDSFRWNSWF